MIFEELTEKEFTDFVETRPEKNFFQTVMMKNRIAKNDLETYLVGVKENGSVIGASFIAETGHHFMGKKTYEAYKGFILDYHNQQLLKFMTEEVKKFLKNKNGLRLIIDPYIVNVSRDMDANEIDGVDNRDVRKYLEELGYRYNEDGEQVKWCYCLDINGKSSEELFNEMRPSTRNNINKTISKFKLNIRTLERNQLAEFKKITSDTCERRDFMDKTLEYYQDMYDFFGDDVTFKICELNCDTYIKSLEEENENLKRRVEELSDSSSNKKKKETMRKDIENNLKKIDDTKNLKEKKGNIIPLSAAMFVLYGDEIVYLFSGSYEELMKFCGQYRLQWEIIKYAADHGYKRYNFYGIQDVFNPQGKDYGVYEFKKGFGGYVEELLGSFILPLSFEATIYDLLRKLKRIVKK
ncbi:MAG TPA: peptidoglycan bridge formation glycyltransferase FemA/FemB family protein [Candidatus Coprovivens excrementavium]|nr:peptidoglycan bridge formation glycyltransferase FemA/FemB family protein [Candidatus Coprovivens excrementavium]